MIISFTGAQSTGKTTLLNLIRDKNYDFNYVDEVTRRIKREYNLPINESGGDITQSMIMADHIANVYKKGDHDVTVLDRCAVDGVVYTQWLYNNGQVKKATLDHAKLIFEMLIEEYDAIFITSPVDVELVDDGERSTNIEFREDIQSLFDMYIGHLMVDNKDENVFVVAGTVEERMNYIQKVLAKKGLDIKI
jgi:dephospho-CoA kinase|tara:strand:- start:443 stop:1018 length:576 start_codon:yes stop_codon:yes gene_type:complete